MTLCSCWSSLLGFKSVSLKGWRWERRLKFQPRGQVSHSPGTHTTACLHTDIPAECMTASEGPGMCVCMCVCGRACQCVCAFAYRGAVFFHSHKAALNKCVKMNTFHPVAHDEAYNLSEQTKEWTSLSHSLKCDTRLKNTHRCRKMLALQIKPSTHYSLHAIHNQLRGWVGVQKSNKSRAPCSLIWATMVPLQRRESREGNRCSF